jgi:hypothetical protein
MKIYIVIYWIQFFSILLSTCASIYFQKHLSRFDYLNNFFFYPTVGLIGILITIIIQNFNSNNFHTELQIFFKLLLLFHYFFLGYKISLTLKIKRFKKIAKKAYQILGIGVLIITFNNIIDNKGLYCFAFVNFVLIFLCIIYYYELISKKGNYNTKNLPSFWLNSGVFISMSLSLPANLFEHYVRVNLEVNNYPIVISIICFSYILLHLLILKSIYHARKFSEPSNISI